MKKVLLIPDSFKGTMSSVRVCEIMKDAILNSFPMAEVVSIPVADGGEGTVDCFLNAVSGKKVFLRASDPFLCPVDSFYGMLPDGKTAVIEMSACAGLPLAKGRKNPIDTTTYGVGEIILHAIGNGADKIVLGLGGSATNDGGCGAAAAMGYRFLDKDGREFIPTGGTLKNICSISRGNIHPGLSKVSITAMCDIENPLFGENGAAYIFAPQKGGEGEVIDRLDMGLRHLAQIIQRDLGVDISIIPGGGAAGGMGAGMMAFFGARLQLGIETVLDTVGFDRLAENVDIVITGEGRLDAMSLKGKVISGVAKRSLPIKVPVIAVVGDICVDMQAVYDCGITAVFSTNREAKNLDLVRHRGEEDMGIVMQNLMRFLAAMS